MIVLSARQLSKYARPPDGDNAGYQKRTFWAWVVSLFPLFPSFIVLAVSKRKAKKTCKKIKIALTSACWAKFIVLDVCTDTREPDIKYIYIWCYNICCNICMFVGKTLCGGEIYRADAIQYQYPIIHSTDIDRPWSSTSLIHIPFRTLH